VTRRRASGAQAILLVALLLAPAAPEWPATTANAALRQLVGQVLYVANPTTVRTRGNGNLSVDLPRGQAVVLVGLGADRVILAPAAPDAELLRAYGVRKLPRYTASSALLVGDFLPEQAWRKVRDEGVRRVRDRWPAITPEQAERIFRGEPYPGMTEDQAEEAVGPYVLARGPVAGQDAEIAWHVGRRPRSAELRIYTEGRERGARARTFEEFLRTKVRATLTFRDGVLLSIDAPAGSSPGTHWP